MKGWTRLSLILGFFLFVFLADFFHFFEAQELGFLDLRFQLRGNRPAHPDIVIVDIDDESINRIGHWPWPRSYHATLLSAVNSYHPRLIFYDVLFTEASTQPKDDQLLAYAIHDSGNVISAFFYHSENPFQAFFPLPLFRDASRFLGYANIVPDMDGRVRRIRKSVRSNEGEDYFPTSVVAALAGRDKEEGLHWLRKIPVDEKGSFWVNYPGKFWLFPRIPFYQIVEKEGMNDPELKRLLQGKIIIVGETATGGGDIRPTPFSPAYPGVGIQASAVHTLLTEDYLRRFEGLVSFIILLVFTLIVTYLTWKNPPLIGLFAVSILTLFYLGWNFLVFCFLGWILPVSSVLLVIFGTYLLALFLQYMQIRFEGELLSRELALAAQIQENFLPQQSPQIEGVDIAFQCLFARTVGGDLYDWVSLGARRLGICVGDVSGKGVPAALYMARAISELRSLAKEFQSPSALLEALNNRLVSDGAQAIFVTLLYLILDLDSKTIFISNAGHEPLLFYKARTKTLEWIRRGGAQPLGLFPDIRYPEEKLTVEDGDFAIIISDGVRELRSPRGEEFGPSGMEKAVDSVPAESADQMVKRIFRSMDEYAKGNPAHDDRTVLCIRIGKGATS